MTKRKDPKDFKPVGRKSAYTSEYEKKLIEFFDIEPWREVEVPHYKRDGTLDYIDKKQVPNRLPTIERFAKEVCHVQYRTIYRWLRNYPRFKQALKTAETLRKWMLIDNALVGHYNSNFAIFTAKNITDMVDDSGGTTVNNNLNVAKIVNLPSPYDRDSAGYTSKFALATASGASGNRLKSPSV